MWFKEKNGASVDVISVGDQSVEASLRKALAIGADAAYRIDTVPADGFSVASELAAAIGDKNYDLIIAGRESIDYNGGMVPGILAHLLGYEFINKCIGLEVDGSTVKAEREIEGGKELLSTSLPLVIGGQKGLVEEKDLKIPNMRGIMTARSKPLEVITPQGAAALTEDVSFDKPAEKSDITMIPADQLDQLINHLHNDAKVI
jgi:electron transfer flavoprotein beta subunit